LTIEKTYSDNELFALLQEDNNDAFRLLYDRYWDKLILQALLTLGSSQEAEEIVQDIFVDLWTRRKSIELKFSFYTYISSCVKYQVLKHLAFRKKKISQESGLLLSLDSKEDTTNFKLDYLALRAQLEESICRLPEKCQLVFRLSREMELSDSQIAKKLSISPKTVEAHLTKALKILRKAVLSASLFLLS
jgi:RNA polymerase sigma-70 factor (family 1)